MMSRKFLYANKSTCHKNNVGLYKCTHAAMREEWKIVAGE